ncbi:hypothetical protein [Melissospora conviva]|uniref:hypothetical protein n=1 Tax=Melissospora conviva TaxID=3388432 RepID=UPI003C29AA27
MLVDNEAEGADAVAGAGTAAREYLMILLLAGVGLLLAAFVAFAPWLPHADTGDSRGRVVELHHPGPPSPPHPKLKLAGS